MGNKLKEYASFNVNGNINIVFLRHIVRIERTGETSVIYLSNGENFTFNQHQNAVLKQFEIK